MLQCARGKHKSEDCNVEYRGIQLTSSHAVYKKYFCTTHQQWTSEDCVSGTLVYSFTDGSEVTYNLTINNDGFYQLELAGGID